MRENHPVTIVEYEIPEGLTLVSRTDLNGTIVECNDSFEIASGFSRDELIGEPHNLVRHPDVPAVVFKDMWMTLQQGMPWSQIVKNRRKDGSFYWVRANVTPVYDQDGHNTGYLSVREPVTSAEKEAAEQAYQDLNSGRASIKYGDIYQGVCWHDWNLWPKLTPRGQMLILMFVVGVMPLLLTHTVFQVSREVLGLMAVLMVAVAWMMGGFLQKSIDQSIHYLSMFAGGKQRLDLRVRPNCIGRLNGAIQSSALAVGAYQSDLESAQDRAERLKLAVDQAWVNMMLLDANHQVSFVNRQLKAFLTKRQVKIQQDISEFKVEKVLGQSINQFQVSNDAAESLEQVVTQLTSTGFKEIELGGLVFSLKLVPVSNRAGVRVGTVVEWTDKTLESQLLNEVRTVHQGVLNGDLSYRVDLDKADETVRPVAEALNITLDAIVRSLDMSTEVAIAMSMGDFQHNIEQACPGYFGVVKEALNVSMENISDILAGVQEVSQYIDEDSQAVRRASIGLSQSSQSQAASIEQTSASMEQMTSAVESSAENAQQAAQQTHEAARKAENGVLVMQQAIESMDSISEASQKIGDIIGLIDSIAFQTNLLALNAAVEAARAGDHGRGFAVVAGEVRNLAGKSADAAKEIRGLIEDTLDRVKQGSDYVNSSGGALQEIQQSIQNVQSIIDEISTSSLEQSQGIGQVNLAIASIDSSVQQNAATAEQTSQMAQQLEGLTHAMTQNAQTFKIKPKGHASALESDANFVRIRMAHRQWRAKARAYIHGFEVGIDPQQAQDPMACELGKWIYSSGKQYADSPSYQKLEMAHQAMHAHIGKILQLKELGDTESATASLDELERLSREVVAYIDDLEATLAESNPRLQSKTPLAIESADRPAKTERKVESSHPSEKTELSVKSQNSEPTQGASHLEGSGDEESWSEF